MIGFIINFIYVHVHTIIHIHICTCAYMRYYLHYFIIALLLFLVNYTVPSGYNYDVSLNVIRKVQVLAASQYFSFNVSIALPKNHLLTEVRERERERGRESRVAPKSGPNPCTIVQGLEPNFIKND